MPEYLKLRFDEKTRGFNAVTFACMTVMSSGISMYALATLLRAILGWNFHLCIAASGVVVLVYIFMGGLRSAIYNEVLQFFLIVFGFLPLVLLGLKQVGGFGLFADPDIFAAHSLGINVDLGWGAVLLAFGATMLGVALRARRRRAQGRAG